MVIRESQPGRRVTWTGPGFMRVSEGDSLIFEIPDIPMSMEYEIVIRYEAQVSGDSYSTKCLLNETKTQF